MFSEYDEHTAWPPGMKRVGVSCQYLMYVQLRSPFLSRFHILHFFSIIPIHAFFYRICVFLFFIEFVIYIFFYHRKFFVCMLGSCTLISILFLRFVFILQMHFFSLFFFFHCLFSLFHLVLYFAFLFLLFFSLLLFLLSTYGFLSF